MAMMAMIWYLKELINKRIRISPLAAAEIFFYEKNKIGKNKKRIIKMNIF